MNIKTFIDNYREAFGEKPELPIAFRYSDLQLTETDKIGGCFFKGMNEVRKGGAISLNENNITCGGGKFYTGFSEMPERVPNFVSKTEKYKETPEMVIEIVNSIGVRRSDKKFLNFTRIDNLSNFDDIEGLLFLANPDVLSGLTFWAFFDNNSDDAVSTTFGSGCSAVVTKAVNENKINGNRTFLGLFDPSVRPYFEEDILSFTIPMSRFKTMYNTMRKTCLFDAHDWMKIKERINRIS